MMLLNLLQATIIDRVVKMIQMKQLNRSMDETKEEIARNRCHKPSLSLSQVQNARKHNKGYKIDRYIQFHESVHFQNILFTNGQLLDPL